MKKSYAKWESYMSDILKYSLKECLSARERAFFQGVLEFGQRLGFTTFLQDKAVGKTISRANRRATDKKGGGEKNGMPNIKKRCVSGLCL